MAKTLGWIAVGGLGVGFVSLALAYVLAGRDLDALLDRGSFLAHSCGDGSGKVDAKQTERRLAWQGGDTVEISLPASVRYRGGEGSEVIVRGSPDVIAHVEVRRGRIMLDCRRFGGIARHRDHLARPRLPQDQPLRLGQARHGERQPA